MLDNTNEAERSDMMRRLLETLLLALLMALVWTCGVPAASWDFIYGGDEIPDDPALGDNLWDLVGTTDICEITPDGELHFVDPADTLMRGPLGTYYVVNDKPPELRPWLQQQNRNLTVRQGRSFTAKYHRK